MAGISARFSNFAFVLFCYITNHLMTGPLGNSEFCFPRISMLPSTSSRETLRFSGNKIDCSPRDQSLSVYCSLLSGHYSVFFWCDLDLSYNVCNKSRRQWALNIHFHKLGFHFLTSSVSISSNLACTVIVTQQQFFDWWKLTLPLVVWFQTGYSIKWEYFWIKS